MKNLSVLITCYNKEKYLNECVTSVLRQTVRPREIIIVHDACENPMHHIQATTIMLPVNMGVVRARAEAVRYSRGELLLFLDGDDILSPDYLEKMTNLMSPKVDIVYPDIYFFGNGNHLAVTLDKFTPKYIKENRKLPIPVTCLMKRLVYETLGGFRDFPVMEDLDFWLRAMANGFSFKKAQTLLWYRQEGDRRNIIDEGKKKRIVSEIIDQFEITNSIVEKRVKNLY